MASEALIQRFDMGKRLSEMAVHNGVAYLAGQVADDASKDIVGQTEEVLKMVDDLLQRAGTDKSKILMAQIHLVDLSDFDGMNSVWDAWVTPDHAPPRATVQSKLADPGWRVEVVVTAAVN
ncbi:Endoribonuclease L-PSP/chorismate mutase-like protein [Tribonema minus]|uniref:Endoribonuclease L-PSP/chorismate mutase-like protein n=1 Tax=Tribonema minus TaxID=303371 RepID=A0A835Z0V8_9STRA|nr:Endoribonuclease L-PSP/chorismate mutase-like protein [Tribonema minus]